MTKIKNKNPFSIKYRIVRFILLMFLFPFFGKINGIQNLPREGAFILAANHSSHIDWFYILLNLTRVLNRHVHFLSTEKYYRNPPYRFLVELSQGIWVSAKEGARSLFSTLKCLKDGKIVVIFPEGTRSLDGKIRKGKTGPAALALAAKVPIIPIGLIDTYRVLPRGAFFLRPAKCKMKIGAPLYFEPYCKAHDEAIAQNDQTKILEIEEKFVRIIMKEIAKLSGQEYPY